MTNKNQPHNSTCPYCTFDMHKTVFGLHLAKSIGNGLGLAASYDGSDCNILLVHTEDENQTVSCSGNNVKLKACPVCQRKFK
jgi:hypothetical protein